jgi:hypoxanthine phosphoribosyltransferase
LIGLSENISGRNIVILEDIIDSGATVEALLEELKEKNPASVKIAALIFKPEAFKRNFSIDYVGLKIPNDFIVGYGMDYDDDTTYYNASICTLGYEPSNKPHIIDL